MKHAIHAWQPVRQARPRYVPDTTPRRDWHELAERALFLIGLVAIPFVLALVPR